VSVDDRDQRFENAATTLAGLAAKHQLHAPPLEASFALLNKLIRKARRDRRKKKGNRPEGDSGEVS
jgi:hypothetical protein